MSVREKKIAMAWLETPTRGIVELTRDWRGRQIPPVSLGANAPAFATFTKVPDYLFGAESGYFVNRKGEIYFILSLNRHPDLEGEDVYLAGDFNGWQEAVGKSDWRLRPAHLAGMRVLVWTARRAERFYGSPNLRFKFVTGKHRWLDVPGNAPNAVRDDAGNVNRVIDPERTGQHLFQFTLAAPLDLSERWTVTLGGDGEPVPLRPGDFFFKLHSDVRLGALARGQETSFRLFAPRAKTVTLCVCETLEQRESPHQYPLRRRHDHAWEVTLSQNLHGWYYWYLIDGPNDLFGSFDPSRPILDPYAIAAVDRDGPGIILDAEWVGRADRSFKTPSWQDLVVAEAHVRDLTERAPIKLTPEERRGFTGLRKWVENPDFYLKHLGVNAVELQPVHEFDNRTPEEYHWGYMSCSFFAVESSYASNPGSASGVKEFQALVEAFHRRGMAVLIDVVYNHVGEPAHLMGVDKLYYFEMDSAGRLSNWSGCGNDFRARSAMSRRMIVDSLIHLIEVYGVDGFRFDLAELLGVDVLREIETILKRVKPDVVLIAEPWSFRGHIAGALRDTGWASWNDGYRNFVRDFVRGGGTREGYEYYLKGSPWYFAKWPSQTVNYVESHDDKTWIDIITENGDGNGYNPTGNDRRRTHLMAAILFASVGIPMISAGQDFIRSKQGVNNTYLRGDLNALEYRRIFRFPSTHAYFADWIEFRRSDAGQLLRLFSRPSEGFFKFFFAPDSTAAATVYNADRSQGGMRMLFAVNPTLNDAWVQLDRDTVEGMWRQVADHEHFFRVNSDEIMQPVEEALYLPPLGCAVWLSLG